MSKIISYFTSSFFSIILIIFKVNPLYIYEQEISFSMEERFTGRVGISAARKKGQNFYPIPDLYLQVEPTIRVDAKIQKHSPGDIGTDAAKLGGSSSIPPCLSSLK